MDNVHQDLVIRDKKALTLNGVINVLDFSELEMTLETSSGTVVIEGEDMKIESLSKESGEINVIGKIEGFYYKRPREKKSFISKILG